MLRKTASRDARELLAQSNYEQSNYFDANYPGSGRGE